MNYRTWLLKGMLLGTLLGTLLGAVFGQQQEALKWNAAQVEHLLNRAAFGATTAEVGYWREQGADALIEKLLTGGKSPEPFKFEAHRADRSGLFGANSDDRLKEAKRVRLLNRAQIESFSSWWIQQMLTGEDPLRERMTLILHGWLVSGVKKVKKSDYMIQQNQLFREKALGNYGELLTAIVQDPAMLLYLDNHTNRRRKPNENLARELMELFSLGEGNYTEEDVRQAARALTGNTVRGVGFVFARKQHDSDPITVLGQSKPMDGDALVELLLRQPSCSRYVANRLILEFEGLAPDEERLQAYATLLQESDFELTPFLDHLFHDPMFYRPEVLGAKVQSPVDFIVGSCHRLQVQPDGELLAGMISMLGQTLMNPPSVKGWDGGYAWLSEGSSLLRSNVIGTLIGQVSSSDLKEGVSEALDLMDEMMAEANDSDEGEMSAPKSRGGPLAKLLNLVRKKKLAVRVPALEWLLSQDATGDKQIARALLDQLLAVAPDPDTERRVVQFIKMGRKRVNIKEGKLAKHPKKASMLLMQAVHLILSLPEANLE